MLLSTTPSELFPSLTSIPKTPHTSPMRTALTLSLFRSLSAPLPLLLHHHHHHHYRRLLLRTVSVINNQKYPFKSPPYLSPLAVNSTPPASVSTLVEQVAVKSVGEENWDFSSNEEADIFDFDASFDSSAELKRLDNAGLSVVVKDLDELPEQWRRSKLAWLCKELPAHKPAALIRILNGQKKWVRQDDLTYVAVHCMRIRENETGFRVYKWMMQQHWFKFDFSLATKLADCMGKERKYLKCREMFDDIINQGRVPTESTFHILTIAYLSSSARGCLEEACAIYNRMIQLGGYRPQLTLHNSLFKALLSGAGGSSKHYLKQAEFIFHNMVTSGFTIHRDVYGGLIWLHSYQDRIDKERIESLRAEMQLAGFEERREVLVSILRACSKEGNVEEAERTWIKLLSSSNSIPSQAFVYKMEVYARIGEPMKSLEVFRDMQEQLGMASTAAFHKIIEVLSKAQAIGLSESMMKEFMNSGMKPLKPAFADLMDMYFCLSLHDKLESTFFQCLEVCRPNRTIYNIYLNSLVQVGNLDKAEEIFNQMQGDCAVGVDTRSCNTILRAYLSSEDYAKAEKTYDFMCRKKYNIEPSLIQKLDYGLSLNRRVVKKPPTPKLSKEQREILVGLLLGGLQIESDETRKNHVLFFQFDQNSRPHSLLKRHIHNHYHEWLAPFSKQTDGSDDVPCEFATIPSSYFGFYADQFWPKGRPEIPKLVHRWLSPRVLAYWYMYGGYRTSSGDILLKLRGDREGVENVVKALKAKSLVCRVKRKGRWFWIGFLGSNSSWFWKLIEPFVLEDLKDLLKAEGAGEAQNIRFDSETDSYERDSDFSEDENS